MDISVVIPLLNEEESLPELTAWIENVMLENKFSYEILFINDGSTDNSWQVIQELAQKNASIKGIAFVRNYGKSAALQVGFQNTSLERRLKSGRKRNNWKRKKKRNRHVKISLTLEREIWRK